MRKAGLGEVERRMTTERENNYQIKPSCIYLTKCNCTANKGFKLRHCVLALEVGQ